MGVKIVLWLMIYTKLLKKVQNLSTVLKKRCIFAICIENNYKTKKYKHYGKNNHDIEWLKPL